MRRLLIISLLALGAVAARAAELPSASMLGGAVEFLPTPALAQSAQAHLAGVGDTLVLSWLEPAPTGGKVLRQAVLSAGGWVARPAVASGTRWFVNWADFPSVVPISEEEGLWAAHWLARRPGGPYSYDVQLSLSEDAGATWSAPFLAHTDGTATEHGFVSLFPWDGAVGALWLDGRYTASDGDHDHGSDAAGGMTLRAGRFGPGGERLQAVEVDGLVCDCCQTDVAMSSAGPVVAYRDRTQDEVRDVHIARLVEGRWLLAGPVGAQRWQVRGCPVNGPAIDAAGERVAVAWYTGADDQSRVKVAFSGDAGASFATEVIVDEAGPLGRVDITLLDKGRAALVSWLRRPVAGERGEISVRYVRSDGRLGPITPAVQTLAGRPSGFPQMAAWGDSLVLAWTDAQAEKVRSARIPLGELLPVATTED